MAYTKYSLTPANNNAAPPDGAPEGMLPSAVNDTMRDMMAQIRDCGDGIRGGIYTMTAPVITGGSINNTPIGASTASSGKFSSLTNTALTAGRVPFASTGGTLADSSAFYWDNLNVRLGVGTSSPLTFLHVEGSNIPYRGQLTINGGSGGTTQLSLYLGGTTQTNLAGQFYANSVGAYLSSYQALPLIFETNGNTERMRITSSGLVGIGTISPNGALTISTQLNALSGTSNTYGLHLYPAPSGICYIDAITNSTSNATLALRTYNNGTYYDTRFNLNGNIVLHGGNTAATGIGLTFPATQSASSDANCLDDYEEGTWTPDIAGVTANYQTKTGTYTKIGNLVTASCGISINSVTSANGYDFQITGFPFAVDNSGMFYTGSFGNFALINLDSDTVQVGFNIGGGSTSSVCRNMKDNANFATISNTALTTNTTFYVTWVYRTA